METLLVGLEELIHERVVCWLPRRVPPLNTLQPGLARAGLTPIRSRS